ncbi:MAG: methylated-DNA--[protein]-cysteine S-methyltransferase [Gemmatimonadales bacterium]
MHKLAVRRTTRAGITRRAPQADPGVRYSLADSPAGRLLVAATERGICAVKLGEADPELEAALRRECPGAARAELVGAGGPLARWVDAIVGRLAGAGGPGRVPVDLRGGGTPFQRRVWAALETIPYGSTRSYADVARAIGQPGAVRAVAQACAANPVALVIPCHRVVGRNGALGGYRWGARRKAVLLERERATVLRAEQRVLAEWLATLPDEAESTPARPGESVTGAATLPPGRDLAGRYEIQAIVGAGGMGVVYRALDRELGEIVALKLLRDRADPTALARFRRELRLARRVSHPNVVRVHDLGEAGADEGGGRFITMEYVAGPSLGAALAQGGPLPIPAAVALGKQLARALAVVHAEGVIHRDLKPQNVLLAADGEAKLADFGIAKPARGDDGRDGPDGATGTLPYMAPEQLLGEPPDRRTDVYALGVVLYEALTGVPPFPSPSPEVLVARSLAGAAPAPRDIRPAIPRALSAVLLRAIAGRREARPESAAELHDALADAERLLEA